MAIDKRIKYLNDRAPKGEFLAYINKKEAAMLKKTGGSGKKVNGIPSFRPQDMGNKSNQKASAANTGMGGSRKGPDKGTGGGSGNIGGGGGGQNTTYRQYSPPTKKTYTADTIDSKPVTGDDFRRSQNEFVDNLNQNNFLRAQQTNTPFVPYQGGARTTDYYNPRNPLSGLLSLAAGIAVPGLGFLMTQAGNAKDGIMSLNNRLRNSDFGRSKNLMDYLDIRNYGGYDEREMARRINMDESKNLQARIDAGEFDEMGVKPVQTFEFDPSNFNTRNVATVNNFGDAAVPGSSYDMAGVNTPFAQQAPEEFISELFPNTNIYNQQDTKYQKRPEQVETEMFFSPQLKSNNIELADDRAVNELTYDQIIDYENLTSKLEGQEMQKTGNPDISMAKTEEIKNKAIDQILASGTEI